MGNLCGKPSKEDDNNNFAGPGRVLGSAPPAGGSAGAERPARASIPPRAATGPGRTLGGQGAPPGSGGRAKDEDDARARARLAAEQRVLSQKSQPKGKLGEQLEAQKKQTRTNTLEEASRETRGARDADANAEARQWN